jgi:hypothetical protein
MRAVDGPGKALRNIDAVAIAVTLRPYLERSPLTANRRVGGGKKALAHIRHLLAATPFAPLTASNGRS